MQTIKGVMVTSNILLMEKLSTSRPNIYVHESNLLFLTQPTFLYSMRHNVLKRQMKF